MSEIIKVIIQVGTVAAIIIGVLGVLFGFGFLGNALGNYFPDSGISGTPFFIVGWIIVIIVIILLAVVLYKYLSDG